MVVGLPVCELENQHIQHVSIKSEKKICMIWTSNVREAVEICYALNNRGNYLFCYCCMI